MSKQKNKKLLAGKILLVVVVLAAVVFAVLPMATSAQSVVPAPVNFTATAQQNTVLLNWDAAEGAEHYVLYRANNENGPFEELAQVNATAYTDEQVQPNQQYYYKLQAVVAGQPSEPTGQVAVLVAPPQPETPDSSVLQSPMATEGTLSQLPAPQGLSGIGHEDSVELEWQEVEGAASYTVYRQSEQGAFEAIEEVPNNYMHDTGLQPGTTYYYKVAANDAVSVEGEQSQQAAVTTTVVSLPEAPANLTVQALNSETVLVTWEEVQNADSYKIYRIDTPYGIYQLVGETVNAEFSNDGLQPNTTYSYKVAAVNAAGTGPMADPQTATTTGDFPGDVNNVAAKALSTTSIELTWDASANATSYNIYRAGTQAGPFESLTTVTATSFVDTGLQPVTAYYYRVEAINSLGASPVQGAANTTTKVPFPTTPSNVAAISVDSNTILVNWDAVEYANSYEVFRSTSQDGTYASVYVGDATSYEDTGLTEGTTYYYYVTATNISGTSPKSPSVLATTPGLVPATPTNVHLDATGETLISVSWNAVQGATSYEIYRSTSENGTYSLIATSENTQYDDDGLTAATIYFYRIAAVNAAGSSEKSSPTGIATKSPVPAVPTNVKATAVDTKTISISWDAVDAATSYSVYRATSENGLYNKMGTCTTTTYQDSVGLNAGTTYYYRVRATNVSEVSEQSSTASATTKTAAPATPTNVRTSPVNATIIMVNWDGVSGATSYKVYRSTSENGTYTEVGTRTATQHMDTGLTASTTYYYRVAAVSDAGTSAQSSPVSGTTKSLAPATPTGVKATAVDTSTISISWTAVQSATTYNVYRSTSASGTYIEVGRTTLTTYEDTELEAGTTYYYRVAASNISGTSAQSPAVTATTPSLAPGIPNKVIATALGANKISVSWDAVEGADSYVIYRSDGGEFKQVGTRATPSFEDTGLTEGTTYYYCVAAVNMWGTSPQSTSVGATTKASVPAAPANAQADPVSSSKISVSWSAVEGASSYEIYRKEGSNFEKVGTSVTTTFEDTGLSAKTTYYYYVVAVNTAGASTPSSPVSATTKIAVPGTPTNVRADSASPSAIVVNWNAVDGADSYEIYRCLTEGGNYEQVGTSDATTYQDTGLSAKTTYYYRVVAVNAAGESPKSMPVNATTYAPTPAKPVNVKAEFLDANKILINWDAVPDADFYEVYRCLTVGGDYQRVALSYSTSYEDTGLDAGTTYYYRIAANNSSGAGPQSNPVNATTQVPLPGTPANVAAYSQSTSEIMVYWNAVQGADSYEIYRCLTKDGNYEQVATRTTTMYIDNGLSSATGYYYRVVAVNAGGASAPSSPAYAVTKTPTPSTPINVQAEALSTSTISVSWNAAQGATSYKIYRSLSAGGTYSEVATSATTTYEDTGLSAATTYYYRVVAVNAGGESAQSSPANATTKTPAPGAPINVQAEALSTSAISVSWNAVQGATSYKIYRSLSSGGTYSEVATSATTTYQDTGLSAATTYYYRVVAVNAGGESAQSSPASATTKTPAPGAPINVQAEALSTSTISVSWNAAQGATSYKIYRSLSAGGTYEQVATSPTTTYQDTGLSAATTYYYRVVAVNAGGESAQSSPASATTKTPAPTTPINVEAEALNTTSISVSWNPAQNTSLYEVYRSESEDGAYSLVKTVSTTMCIDSGLEVGTTYYYHIVAVHKTEKSEKSSSANATTHSRITYNAVGGSLASAGQVTLASGTTATAPANPTKTGLTFAGWFKDKNYANQWHFDTDIAKGDITLYARWEAAVSFDSNGGTNVSSAPNVQEGGKITQPAAPSREGLSFDGWYKDQQLTQKWNFNTDTVESDTVLYAKWSASVTFNSNGGSQVANTTGISIGSTIKTPEPPTRKNYTFGGWYKEEGCINKWNFGTDKVQKNTTLYAKWSHNQWSVEYRGPSGAQFIPNKVQNVAVGDTFTIANNIPYLPGHDFTGWKMVSLNNNKLFDYKENESFTMPDHDVVLEAVFVKSAQGTTSEAGSSSGGASSAPVSSSASSQASSSSATSSSSSSGSTSQTEEQESGNSVAPVIPPQGGDNGGPNGNGTGGNGTPNAEDTPAPASGNAFTQFLENVGVPLGSFTATGGWALVNLLCAIAAILMAVISLVMLVWRKMPKYIALAAVVILAVAVVLVFVFTSNFSQPVTLINIITPVVAAILVAQIVSFVLYVHKGGKTGNKQEYDDHQDYEDDDELLTVHY